MKYFVVLLLALCVGFYACTKDVGILPQAPPLTDSLLFTYVKDSANQTPYLSTTSQSTFTSDAAHGSKLYKLMVNTKARNSMTDGGKLPVNGSFPDSSLMVKKLYNTSNQVDFYAVMYKKDGAWKWAEFNASGTVVKSINSNSDNCISCHASDRDRVNTFVVHP
ncbi:MAG: cytochrome P460 family protein [Bacteroidota bacterium]|nr:cytochrome P460 family protein [Bacteroidota bacterium]